MQCAVADLQSSCPDVSTRDHRFGEGWGQPGFASHRDFKVFQNAVADKRLELERRRLHGKSNVKIPVAMQDDAAAKRSLSV